MDDTQQLEMHVQPCNSTQRRYIFWKTYRRIKLVRLWLCPLIKRLKNPKFVKISSGLRIISDRSIFYCDMILQNGVDELNVIKNVPKIWGRKSWDIPSAIYSACPKCDKRWPLGVRGMGYPYCDKGWITGKCGAGATLCHDGFTNHNSPLWAN